MRERERERERERLFGFDIEGHTSVESKHNTHMCERRLCGTSRQHSRREQAHENSNSSERRRS